MTEKKFEYKSSFRIKILLGFLTVLLISLMFPKGESIESEVNAGDIWIHDDLIASFSFPVIKDPKVYKAEVESAEKSVYPIFIENPNGTLVITDSLNSYSTYLLKIIDNILLRNSSQEVNPTFLSSKSFGIFLNLRRQERNMLIKRGFTLKELAGRIQEILENIAQRGIINPNTGLARTDSIALRVGNIDKILPVSIFQDVNEAREKVKSEILSTQYPPDLEKALEEYASHFIIPTIVYNQQATEEELKQAVETVSKTTVIVNENERIIAKHERITEEAKLKIDSYKVAKGEKIGEEGYFTQAIGNFLHIGFLLSIISIYFYLFRKRIFHDNEKLLLIALLFIFLSLVTFLINQMDVNAPLQYLIFIPAASMLLTIIFDSRVGFYATVIIVLITGALRGNDYTFTAMNLFAGVLAVYTVRDIKNRSQIFRSFLFILMGYFITVLAFGLERFASFNTILAEFAFAGTNALISPVLTYGLLIFFERLFRITTDLTLLELSNFDRPLLKELARKAPGTFNHSMTMGTLAEAAAEKIGANSLLARIGAYYHDIGKTLMPQNFVENQLNNQNIHENLSPEESVDLIVRHVNEGIELARKNMLPREVVDFIPMHHGTTVMSFFYEKARQLYGEDKVNIDDYKYPGPKPNSRETAIIMLADGCESAVRSIDEPDQVKVENVIEQIIKARIDDGQLDDAPVTFRDISRIKEAFLSILIGQHHRRIRYPKQEEMEKGVSITAGKEQA